MFVDASAMVAMMTNEDDARSLAARMQAYKLRITSPSAKWETALGVARNLALEIPEASAADESGFGDLTPTNRHVLELPLPNEVNGKRQRAN